jgi:hypothetical protein
LMPESVYALEGKQNILPYFKDWRLKLRSESFNFFNCLSFKNHHRMPHVLGWMSHSRISFCLDSKEGKRDSIALLYLTMPPGSPFNKLTIPAVQ